MIKLNASTYIFPDFIVEKKAPSPLLERNRHLVSPASVVVADGYLIRAACAYLKRDDIRLFVTPDELTYGLGCYGVSVVVWLMVLSRVDVSYAYPMLSVGYIVAALAGKIFFGESVDLVRWTGITTICIGVWLITRTA